MQSEIKKKILGKNGGGNIKALVIFLSVLMLFSFILCFYQEVRITETIKEGMELSLSLLIRDKSREILDELKNGSSDFYNGTETVLEEVTKDYKKYIKKEINLESIGNNLLLKDENGKTLAEIYEIKVKKSSDGLSLIASLKIKLSFIFMGETYENVSFPIEIRKRMKLEKRF